MNILSQSISMQKNSRSENQRYVGPTKIRRCWGTIGISTYNGYKEKVMKNNYLEEKHSFIIHLM